MTARSTRLSRTFGYLNQRLGAIAALLALIWAQGLLGLMFVDLLVGGVFRLTHWSLSLTAPASQLETVFGWSDGSGGAVAGAMHVFWLGIVRLLAHGWVYSFVWTAAAILYLWLRHDVDGTPWDEIEATGTAASHTNDAIPGSAPGSPVKHIVRDDRG